MNWWDQVEPNVADLAKRLALHHGQNAEAQCVPYPPYLLNAPAGQVTLVRMSDLAPVWTCFVTLARDALLIRDDQAVDAVVPAPVVSDDLPVTFTDDADAKWRRERGLDSGQDSE